MNKADWEALQQAVAEISPPSDTKLVRALQYANEWLRYGEAKHAVLIALNGATLTALNNLAKPDANTSGPMKAWFWCAVVLCAVSILVSLSSFYARTDPNKVLKLGPRTQSATGLEKMAAMTMRGPNLVFFGHLAQMSPDEVLKALVGPYNCNSDNGYLCHMAQQVVINSRLALQKSKLFNVALSVYILPAILLIVALVAAWLFPGRAMA